MALFGLKTKNSQTSQVSESLESFLFDYSIEVSQGLQKKLKISEISYPKIQEFILLTLKELQLKIW